MEFSQTYSKIISTEQVLVGIICLSDHFGEPLKRNTDILKQNLIERQMKLLNMDYQLSRIFSYSSLKDDIAKAVKFCDKS